MTGVHGAPARFAFRQSASETYSRPLLAKEDKVPN